jgi:hypothetical protein
VDQVPRTFDRLIEFDARSREFPIRMAIEALKPRSYTWACGTWLDQGRERACVGFAWAHEAAARPMVRKVDRSLALQVYKRAQQLDQWPGENYSGTSVLAGAKAMAERNLIRSYRWAFGLDDALVAISRFGPAVVGVNWYEGMSRPDSRGYIRPTGGLGGGHAILANGVSVRNRTVLLHNSWGQGWGRGGRALISWDDFGRLLSEQGECCIPVLR